MQTPTRRADKKPRIKADATMTMEKYRELQAKVEKLLKIKRPREAEEVKRLAMMGDFSENAGYQLAKSRLRGINQRILDIEDLLKRAEIIETDKDCSFVQLGHTVTVEINNKLKKYQILGSAETNPTSGIISHNSPLGLALLNHQVGEVVEIKAGDKIVAYKIIKIN